jgi:tetratricopeptide (TPR) repeat protein
MTEDLDERLRHLPAADAPALIALAAPREHEAWSRPPDVDAIQSTKLAFEQGRFDDAKGILTAALANVPRHPVLTAMLATALAELGDAEEAGRLVDALAAAAPPASLRTAAWAYSSEAVAIIGDTVRAAPIYERFQRYAGQVVAAGAVANCPGSVDRYLGQLAATRCQWDVAQRHYLVALRVDEGLRSPPLLARTRYWYGRMLVERGRSDDAGEARDLLDASRDVAERLGMAALARQAAEVRPRL